MPGLTIGRSPEPELLGTSGGLSRAAARFGLGSDAGGPLLVLNGDTLPTFDLGEMASFHGAAGAEATLLCDPRPGPEFSGERRLETGGDGVITGLSGPGGPGFGFSGVWLLEPAALRHLHGGPGGLSQDLLPGLIAARTARAFPEPGSVVRDRNPAPLSRGLPAGAGRRSAPRDSGPAGGRRRSAFPARRRGTVAGVDRRGECGRGAGVRRGVPASRGRPRRDAGRGPRIDRRRLGNRPGRRPDRRRALRRRRRDAAMTPVRSPGVVSCR